jgi:hypothetical protein
MSKKLKGKVTKRLLKNAFEFDKKHGAHDWSKCAWNKPIGEKPRYSGLRAVSKNGRTIKDTTDEKFKRRRGH